MRPNLKSYTLSTADLVGFASNVTGATWTLTATSVADGLAHQVTIRNDSATNHSAKTATLVGTDENGKAQTETMALPAGSATTTSTKYFKTLTSITPSATIGVDTMDIGFNNQIAMPWIPVDYRSTNAANIQVDISGTINYTVQFTFANVLDNVTPMWTAHATLTGTADAAGQLAVGTTAFRVITSSYNAGATLSVYYVQTPNP